ncbi:MAG: glutaredoxin domain-containing protein [Chloroflexota bacterium]
MSDQDLYTLSPSRIVVYSVDWCPDCRRARFFFKRKEISVLEINVDQDKQAAEFVKQVNHGNRSVPTIIFPDGTKLVEPSEAELNAKFN